MYMTWMVYFLLAFAVFIVIGGHLFFTSKTNKGTIIGIILVIIGIICFIAGNICIAKSDKLAEEVKKTTVYWEEKETNFFELVSLNDTTQFNGSIHGNRYYINGSISEEDAYSFYYILGDGYKKEKIPAYNTIIYEYDLNAGVEKSNTISSAPYKIPDPSNSKYSILYDESGKFKPGIIEYTIYCRYKLTDRQKYLLQESDWPKEYSEKRYEIHIPKGTILREFNLDSQ